MFILLTCKHTHTHTHIHTHTHSHHTHTHTHKLPWLSPCPFKDLVCARQMHALTLSPKKKKQGLSTICACTELRITDRVKNMLIMPSLPSCRGWFDYYQSQVRKTLTHFVTPTRIPPWLWALFSAVWDYYPTSHHTWMQLCLVFVCTLSLIFFSSSKYTSSSSFYGHFSRWELDFISLVLIHTLLGLQGSPRVWGELQNSSN